MIRGAKMKMVNKMMMGDKALRDGKKDDDGRHSGGRQSARRQSDGRQSGERRCDGRQSGGRQDDHGRRSSGRPVPKVPRIRRGTGGGGGSCGTAPWLPEIEAQQLSVVGNKMNRGKTQGNKMKEDKLKEDKFKEDRMKGSKMTGGKMKGGNTKGPKLKGDMLKRGSTKGDNTGDARRALYSQFREMRRCRSHGSNKDLLYAVGFGTRSHNGHAGNKNLCMTRNQFLYENEKRTVYICKTNNNKQLARKGADGLGPGTKLQRLPTGHANHDYPRCSEKEMSTKHFQTSRQGTPAEQFQS